MIMKYHLNPLFSYCLEHFEISDSLCEVCELAVLFLSLSIWDEWFRR